MRSGDEAKGTRLARRQVQARCAPPRAWLRCRRWRCSASMLRLRLSLSWNRARARHNLLFMLLLRRLQRRPSSPQGVCTCRPASQAAQAARPMSYLQFL
mmetsp:Transcript_13874/g.30091  ORF Transcript_13874/g.30091 Transcript_13874/m.30091 type:complete len:99 (+) Transcript_13874:144-440(+)